MSGWRRSGQLRKERSKGGRSCPWCRRTEEHKHAIRLPDGTTGEEWYGMQDEPDA